MHVLYLGSAIFLFFFLFLLCLVYYRDLTRLNDENITFFFLEDFLAVYKWILCLV